MTAYERHTERQSPPAHSNAPDAAIGSLLLALGRPGEDPSLAVLHRVVCERVTTMRDGGATPESVLAALKTLAAAAVAEAGAARTGKPGEAAALVSQVGQWCIAEYFRRS